MSKLIDLHNLIYQKNLNLDLEVGCGPGGGGHRQSYHIRNNFICFSNHMCSRRGYHTENRLTIYKLLPEHQFHLIDDSKLFSMIVLDFCDNNDGATYHKLTNLDYGNNCFEFEYGEIFMDYIPITDFEDLLLNKKHFSQHNS